MQDAFAHCEALVRAADKDRFLSTLFAPADRRPGLFALYAFNIEIARVREAVRDPVAGEIRLQWWSDALSGEARGDADANPVAAALLGDGGALRPLGPLPAGPGGRARGSIFTTSRWRRSPISMRYADGVSSNLVSLAALILDAGHTSNALATAAGRAYAIAGLLKAFPAHAARGQLYVPVEVLQRHGADRIAALSGPAAPPLRAALAEMRATVRDLLTWGRGLIDGAPPQFLPALLPVALVGPTLDRMDRPDYDPFVPVDIPQWRRQWLIWRASRRPARIFVATRYSAATARAPSQCSRSSSARRDSACFFARVLSVPRRRWPSASRDGACGERRKQPEVDVHRLEGARAGIDGLDVPAGDVARAARRARWSAAARSAARRAVRRRRSGRPAVRSRPTPHSLRSR